MHNALPNRSILKPAGRNRGQASSLSYSAGETHIAKNLTLLAAVVLIGLSIFTFCRAQEPTPSPAADREARWRQDLKFFADQFTGRHADFAKLYPQPAFDNELAGPQAAIPKPTPAAITLPLMLPRPKP